MSINAEVFWVAGVTTGMGVLPLLLSMWYRWRDARIKGGADYV